jgi:UDP-N-acetylglucosamine--N-acetylmuramyl-(pentapeptide) pyrophosphoryl-undecaprenol N-acetylglucosamine transferase
MKGSDNLHIVIASGGTGGHFYPSLAIAQEARREGHEVTMLLAGRHVGDQLRIAAENDIRSMPVPAAQLPSLRNPLSVPPFFWRFFRSMAKAHGWARRAKPDVVLGMGSFASAPTALGMVFAGAPLVIHEGNAWMGKANRWLSRFARVAALSLPLVPECRCSCPQVQTGMPLRKAIIDAAASREVSPEFWEETELAPDLKTILVFGGSQGAEAINGLMPQCLAALGDDAARVQFIHFTGSHTNDVLHEAYSRAGVRAVVKRHDPRIERAYMAADLVICRGGASSICELALFGKPAILIPLPTAAEDHQTANARSLAEKGAAWLLPQREAKAEMLADLIADFLRNSETWQQMGERVHTIAKSNATQEVVQLLEKHARHQRR